MASPHAFERSRVKLDVLTRIATGMGLNEVCALPEMPVVRTILRWAATDPGFEAELAQAYARGAYRWMAFDPATAATFVARMDAGERVKAILADPAMPSRRVYRHRLAMDQTFAEDIHRLKNHKAACRDLRSRAR